MRELHGHRRMHDRVRNPRLPICTNNRKNTPACTLHAVCRMLTLQGRPADSWKRLDFADRLNRLPKSFHLLIYLLHSQLPLLPNPASRPNSRTVSSPALTCMDYPRVAAVPPAFELPWSQKVHEISADSQQCCRGVKQNVESPLPFCAHLPPPRRRPHTPLSKGPQSPYSCNLQLQNWCLDDLFGSCFCLGGVCKFDKRFVVCRKCKTHFSSCELRGQRRWRHR